MHEVCMLECSIHIFYHLVHCGVRKLCMKYNQVHLNYIYDVYSIRYKLLHLTYYPVSTIQCTVKEVRYANSTVKYTLSNAL